MRHNSPMAQTAAQRAKAYRQRRREQQLATRPAATCRVCGTALNPDRRADQELCSQRCRQRLTELRGGRDREGLLNSDVHSWRWSWLECRRLARKGLHGTPEQQQRAEGWQVVETLRAREGHSLRGGLNTQQMMALAKLRKEVAAAVVAGRGHKRAEKAWGAYLEQLVKQQPEPEESGWWDEDEED